MKTPTYEGYTIIYGGNGNVAKACTKTFKANKWWVCCVNSWKTSQSKDGLEEPTRSTHSITNPFDTSFNLENLNKLADLNILVHPNKNINEQERDILTAIGKELGEAKVDTVICLAGGFTPGNASEELTNATDLMWKQNVWPSIISTSISVAYLKQGGFLCLSGARAALGGTPNTISYGLTKAAIHQLIKSLASEGSALPANTLCLGLLPVTIDVVIDSSARQTPGDISSWTPTKYITDLLYKWSIGENRPKNGSLVQFITKDFITNVSFMESTQSIK